MERNFIIKPYDIGYLFFIKCITPIHVGAISGRQMVDKSVQRDNLELPMIFSSSIKGAIRHQVDNLSEICGKDIDKKKLFGQEPGEPTPRPGSIVFLDARLLFIPTREIDLTYVYVTSPILLHKLFLYYEVIHGKRLIDDEDLNKILVEEGKFIILSTGKGPRNIEKKEKKGLYVNERELICQGILDEKLREKFTNILKIIGIENEPIIIISDKDIVPIANDSTIVYWRNRLKKDMKVVERGALWSEEYIPDGTVFVSGVFLSTSMLLNEEEKLCEKVREDAKKLLEKILKDKYYFVGGLETIGKGLIKTILFEGDSK